MISDQTDESDEQIFWQRAGDDNKLTRELDDIMKSFGVAFEKQAKEIEKQVKDMDKMKGM